MKRQVLGNSSEIWLEYGVNNEKKATVNYYFDEKTSNATRQAFLRAAKAWEKDTCINFTKKKLEAYKEQFNRTEWYEFTKYGLPYDYGSIMHYESKRTNPMMTPKNDHYMGTIGSPMISFIDLSMINEHYYCKTKCVGTRCENGGFPHPRDCSECICPGGYGGRLCNELPNDLGGILNATSNSKILFMTHYNTHRDLDYLKRTYWIKPTEENVKIEVNMTIINGNLDVPGCALAGVEIKNEEDKTVTGHRYAIFSPFISMRHVDYFVESTPGKQIF
ncbi:astacin [Ancylostoma caninum]|uniref:Astacin n=1 Tax=Ancylostoma caninum TaxID=29170 RepID=A0A368FIP9_ANCCA|nr:astacin [Ancylostoma caninum]